MNKKQEEEQRIKLERIKATGYADFYNSSGMGNEFDYRGAPAPSLPRGGKAQDCVFNGETPFVYGRSGIAPDFNAVHVPVVYKPRSPGITDLMVGTGDTCEIPDRFAKIISAEDGADYFVSPRGVSQDIGKFTCPKGHGVFPLGSGCPLCNMEENAEDICDTTMTRRANIYFCRGCGTYEGNLGPCDKWECGANRRCSYCDHGLECHIAAGSAVAQDEKKYEDYFNKFPGEDFEVGALSDKFFGSPDGENKSGGATGKDRRNPVAVQEDGDGAESPAVGVGKPGVDMQALWDICAGRTTVPLVCKNCGGDKFHGNMQCVICDPAEPHEVDLCGFKSYNETDGENYICGKEVHGPKVKHGEWIKV